LNKFENHKNYNCEATTENGEKILVYSGWLHNQGLDYWKGWTCHAGYTRLFLDKDLNVWDGICENTNLGHAIDGFADLMPVICKRERCTGCTEDLLIYKHSPGYDQNV
jgi:hypothetical protein